MRNMKRFFSIVLVLLMLTVMLYGCQTNDTNDGGTTGGDTGGTTGGTDDGDDSKGYVIGISYGTYEDYQVEWEKYARAYAEPLGVTIITTSADGKMEKQVSDVESLIVQEPDAIMIWALDSDAMVSTVDMIYDSGITCIVTSYWVNTDNYDLYLYADQILTGNMQAEYCNQWVEDHPGETLNCGYIWGATGISGCIDRFDGWHDASVATNENIVLLDEQIGNWATADAMAITEDWLLAYPEMNAIVCMNDEMALGVIQALQAANIDMDDFVVLGIDGSESGMQEIRNGTLDATVFENRRLDAELQMQYVIEYLDGQTFENKDCLIKCKQLMTPDNIDEILDSIS